MMLAIPVCTCQQKMVPTLGKPDLFVCLNCDVVQESERPFGGKRIATLSDRRFKAHWAKKLEASEL